MLNDARVKRATKTSGASSEEILLPGSDGEHELQCKYNSAARAQAFYEKQMLHYLNREMQVFIARQEMVFIGTSDRKGEADVSFRAGEPGFVKVLDAQTVAYPEYRGNGVMASLGNISENPHIGLMFLDFTVSKIGLHVNGSARILECHEFLLNFPAQAVNGGATSIKPERWVIVGVAEAFIHCSKHIPLMKKIPHETLWGTDDVQAKGGDFFKVKALKENSGPANVVERDPQTINRCIPD